MSNKVETKVASETQKAKLVLNFRGCSKKDGKDGKDGKDAEAISINTADKTLTSDYRF